MGGFQHLCGACHRGEGLRLRGVDDMAEKRWEGYLDEVLSFVKFKYDHKAIRRELEDHMENLREELLTEGMEETAADVLTIAYMGDAAEIGQALDKEHGALLGWIWRVTRALVILLVLLNSSTFIRFGYDVISPAISTYHLQSSAAEVLHLDGGKWKAYDDTLDLKEIIYYENGTIDIRYTVKRNPLAKSIDGGFNVLAVTLDEKGERIYCSSTGWRSGGKCYKKGQIKVDMCGEKAKTLVIYWGELELWVDLETGEVPKK